MFFITYLRRELRRRMRQAVFIALGLALGVGLVVTVAAASAGVKKAEAGVLGALYGVGTDITVTGAVESPAAPEPPKNPAGQTVYELFPPLTQPISASNVAAVARLHDVAAASGAIALTDNSISNSDRIVSFTVDGVDTGQSSVGPLAAAATTSGHLFTAADADADFAVVDSGYAASNGLKVGSAITIKQVRFTVIGIVSQPQGSRPPDVYIPLARAQAQASATKTGGSLAGEVTLIYVTAASAADVPAVQREISRLLPGDTVTTASSLASQVTGSLSSAATLTSDLGKWVSVLALIAAFAVASLLTLAAVARRATEFGTLKALGWRSRQIIAQVLGESLAIGIAGAAAGTGLGFAGAAIIAKIAPKLTAGVLTTRSGLPQTTATSAGVPYHAVLVPLSPTITASVVVVAVTLALASGLLAGLFGSWRISSLRPADALAQVA